MLLSAELSCTCYGRDVFVNWTLVFLLWDRCVCKLNSSDLTVGQTYSYL